MTEVSEMTDAELAHHIWYYTSWPGRLPGPVPKYCTDPSASLEVQAASMKKSTRWYKHHLALVTGGWTVSRYPVPFDMFDAKIVDAMILATPRQRAEAAYMVLRGDDIETPK